MFFSQRLYFYPSQFTHRFSYLKLTHNYLKAQSLSKLCTLTMCAVSNRTKSSPVNFETCTRVLPHQKCSKYSTKCISCKRIHGECCEELPQPVSFFQPHNEKCLISSTRIDSNEKKNLQTRSHHLCGCVISIPDLCNINKGNVFKKMSLQTEFHQNSLPSLLRTQMFSCWNPQLQNKISSRPQLQQQRYLSVSANHAISRKEYTFPELLEDDLEEMHVRGSGPGGQATNKTANCVVLKHKPTGVTVKCHETRSLVTNRQRARERLIDRLDLHFNGENSFQMLQKKEESKKKAEKKRKARKRLELKKAMKEENREHVE